MPPSVDLLLQLTKRWDNIRQEVRSNLFKGVPKPPEWVVERYFSEYCLAAAQVHDAEKDIPQVAPGKKLAWVSFLKVQPKLDIWADIEKKLYGEVVSESIQEYLDAREMRIMLYPSGKEVV